MNLQYLANIYNLLLDINTKGEDSFKMTDALRALQQFILEQQKQILEHEKEE